MFLNWYLFLKWLSHTKFTRDIGFNLLFIPLFHHLNPLDSFRQSVPRSSCELNETDDLLIICVCLRAYHKNRASLL
ncbi:protein of unknown function [Xenorhabdus poinarii G6]|uniref:Uncharacterized protein n=1 Tax=Xenorhabdus poinarii G6 TaxID=1354304 RepID=A0A068R1G9_9GAMM|nr:protein of unknown function [Xenorhabdus poinarii G6]